MPLTFDIGLTLGVLAACVAALVATAAAPDAVLCGGLVLLVACGVVPLSGTYENPGALDGLGNPGLAAVGILFAVAEGLRQTGAVEYAGRQLLGRPSGTASAVFRVAAPAAVVSAFLNNTPVVAAALPVVSDWAKRHGMSPSKVLMPLSFAAVLGGMCTLIGTSTLLVLNGELVKLRTPDGGTHPGLELFDITWVGLPCAVLGVAFLAVASKWLLPDRTPAGANLRDTREYAVEMTLQPDSPMVGQTVEGAGLRHLPGAYLLEIVRDVPAEPSDGGTDADAPPGAAAGPPPPPARTEQVVAAVGPNERLRAGDRLVFVGAVDSVKDLRRLPGLTPAADQTFKLDTPSQGQGARQLVEAVVSDGYPFLDRTVRESRFRSHYNAAIIAVARGGERVVGKIGDIRLRPGDTLLLEAPPGFVKLRRFGKHFFLVSGVADSVPPRFHKAWIARVILAAMVTAMFFDVPPALAAAIACGAMIFTRCLLISEARRAVDWSVLITMAAGLGLGAALQNSGTDDYLAHHLTTLAGANAHAQLAVTFLLTAVLANLITAKAAGVLTFGIALAVAEGLNLDPLPFVIAVMAAASGVFAGPVGFQTNLMVYGPGGYKTSDYLRLGLPLTALVFAVTMLVVPQVWPFTPAPAATDPPPAVSAAVRY
ncbi:SLC13 family permease [Alienimonas sp. DA493]|uniref:SLC13 family permease n=1 Tax=Alienimonas sp. DA493 TaxID=3373605 RepID=UPI003754498A